MEHLIQIKVYECGNGTPWETLDEVIDGCNKFLPKHSQISYASRNDSFFVFHLDSKYGNEPFITGLLSGYLLAKGIEVL